MPGSPGTLPAPELPAERRLALVVATSTYIDSALRQLRAPAQDAADFSSVLADPGIGGFTVTQVINSSAQEIRLAIDEFVTDRQPDDLLVIYLSCHGLVDARRRLYFAAADTLKHRLAATGVESEWLLDQLEDCRARRQVVILDCCFSGAFARGAKGDTDLDLGARFHGHGRGRVILTASRGTEYSFEGDPVPGSVVESGSVFTSALVKGIRTGDADRDHDGYISVDEAYRYTYDTVRAANANQTPQLWAYGAEGHILLARNPSGGKLAPSALPESIRAALDNPHPAIRLGAVTLLGEWLTGDDLDQALLARETLQHIADNDIRRVAKAARELLETAQPEGPTADPLAVPAHRLSSTQEELVREIGRAMLRKAPEGWRHLAVHFRAVGGHRELVGSATLNETVTWSVPRRLGDMFAKLRQEMYQFDNGTWNNAHYTLDPPSSYNLDCNRDEPQWLTPPPAHALIDELRMFPLAEANIPQWLTRQLSNVPTDQLRSFFRVPEVYSGNRPPNRHNTLDNVKSKLLDYLMAAPVVARRDGGTDLFAARPGRTVPSAYHTDGFWLWPATVYYYLRKYDVDPDQALTNHILRRNFQLPRVNAIVRELAAKMAAKL
jgi:hypothetical protein